VNLSLWPDLSPHGVSVMLRKSLAAGVIFRSQVLELGVDPIHADVLVGEADVVPHDVDLGPGQGTPSVLLPAASQELASMSY